MIIIMDISATSDEVRSVVERLTERGFDVHTSTGASRTVLGVVGDTLNLNLGEMSSLPGVGEVIRITAPYKLVGRVFRRENTHITIRNVTIGGPEIIIMAGPCAVESREQIQTIAQAVRAAGARILRGGAFKPRSSPYAFQGLGLEGLKMLRQAADDNGLLVVSEIMDRQDLAAAVRYVDIIQIGARNMQNYSLLKEIGRMSTPALLKRGMSATLQETLMSAEYIMAGGNHQVILCERGIRTFESFTRNTLDISAIPILKKLSHLPVIADPSHGAGLREHVPALARAAIAAGADGLLIEVHHDPDHALSDGTQSMTPEEFRKLIDQLRVIAPAVGRSLMGAGQQ